MHLTVDVKRFSSNESILYFSRLRTTIYKWKIHVLSILTKRGKLGGNKPFLKLIYLLWELSGHVFFQLFIVVRNLEKSKIDSFLENILTLTVKCIKPNCYFFSPVKYNVISTYPKITSESSINAAWQILLISDTWAMWHGYCAPLIHWYG
jgi:hypothetical protein